MDQEEHLRQIEEKVTSVQDRTESGELVSTGLVSGTATHPVKTSVCCLPLFRNLYRVLHLGTQQSPLV